MKDVFIKAKVKANIVEGKATNKIAVFDAKGKPVSVYGNTMKAARICGKILPDPLLASLMKRTNQIR